MGDEVRCLALFSINSYLLRDLCRAGEMPDKHEERDQGNCNVEFHWSPSISPGVDGSLNPLMVTDNPVRVQQFDKFEMESR